MTNFQPGGSASKEFERIAQEKGWVVDPRPVRKVAALSKDVVARVQGALKKMTGLAVSDPTGKYDGNPDGVWGPRSAAAWNKFVNLYDDLSLVFNLTPVDPSGRVQPTSNMVQGFVKMITTVPADRFRQSVMKEHIPTEMVKSPQMREYLETMSPKAKPEKPAVPVQPGMTEHIPTGLVKSPQMREYLNRADDVVAHTVNSLVKLANDLDDMGSKDAALAVDRQLKLYKEAVDKLYDVTGETGEDLINKAHPGGGPTIVPAKEEGGKVETIVEEHKKLLDKVKKMPTGKYAEIVQELIVKANTLDDAGQTEAAKAIDSALREIISLPFVDRSSAIEAAGSEDNTASVKTAAEDLKQFIPAWDAFVKYFDDASKYFLETEVFVKFFYPNVKLVKQAYNKIQELKVQLARDWKAGKLNKEQLKLRLNDIYRRFQNISDYITGAAESMFGKDKTALKLHKTAEEQLVKLINSLQVEKPTGKVERATSGYTWLLNRYLGTLNKILEILKSPTQKVIKVLGGAANVADWQDDILAEISKAKNYSKEELAEANTLLYNRLYKKIASNNQQIVVRADLLDRLRALTPAPRGGPGMPTRGPRKRQKISPYTSQIAQLQQAMIDLGIELPASTRRGKPDGVWGPEMRNKIKDLYAMAQKAFPGLQVSPPTDTPTQTQLAQAIRIANNLKYTNVPTENVSFDFLGTTLNTVDLINANTFLQALDARNLIVDQNDKQGALQIIQRFARENARDPNYVRKLDITYGPETTRQIFQSFARITNELKSQKQVQPTTQEGKTYLAPESPNEFDELERLRRQIPDRNYLYSAERFKGATPRGQDPIEYLKSIRNTLNKMYSILRRVDRTNPAIAKVVESWNRFIVGYLDQLAETERFLRAEEARVRRGY